MHTIIHTLKHSPPFRISFSFPTYLAYFHYMTACILILSFSPFYLNDFPPSPLSLISLMSLSPPSPPSLTSFTSPLINSIDCRKNRQHPPYNSAGGYSNHYCPRNCYSVCCWWHIPQQEKICEWCALEYMSVWLQWNPLIRTPLPLIRTPLPLIWTPLPLIRTPLHLIRTPLPLISTTEMRRKDTPNLVS